jgi:hypothetical protein
MSSNELNPGADASERREFFRVDDSVNIRYNLVRPEDLSSRLQSLEDEVESNFTVVSSLAAITQQSAGLMHKIESERPEIAAYLKSLDRKIELIGRTLMTQDSEYSEQPAQAANLSATGMAFHARERIEPGSLLEMRLVLLPSFIGMLIYAEVVGCEEMESSEGDYRHTLRVNFNHMRESDKDVLIRHVIKRQGRLLRKERESREEA